MSDIVERLRALTYDEEILEEAADEIERLRSLADSLGEDNRRYLEQLIYAAAFLDGIADRLESAPMAFPVGAADCRAMAEKLRK